MLLIGGDVAPIEPEYLEGNSKRKERCTSDRGNAWGCGRLSSSASWDSKAELKQHQEAELQHLQTALRTHTEALTNQARVVEVESYRRRARDLQRLIEDTNQFMADATQALREKDGYETQQLLTAIRKVVRELGEGQGYSLILAGGATTAGALSFTPATDLTPQVMQRFDHMPADRPVSTSGGAPPLAKKKR